MVLEEESTALAEGAPRFVKSAAFVLDHARQVKRVREIEPVAGRPVRRECLLRQGESFLELGWTDPAARSYLQLGSQGPARAPYGGTVPKTDPFLARAPKQLERAGDVLPVQPDRECEVVFRVRLLARVADAFCDPERLRVEVRRDVELRAPICEPAGGFERAHPH